VTIILMKTRPLIVMLYSSLSFLVVNSFSLWHRSWEISGTVGLHLPNYQLLSCCFYHFFRYQMHIIHAQDPLDLRTKAVN
jgi:hypothetical protein